MGDYSASVYAASAIALLTGLNIIGTQQGKWTQNLLTAAKVCGFLLVIVSGLTITTSSSAAVIAPSSSMPPGNFGLAMIFVLYQFSKGRLQIIKWNQRVQTSVMAGVYKLEIEQSEAELKQLLGAQRTAVGKERVQLLYLLKTGQAATIQLAARLLGRHRVTVQGWLSRYRSGGIELMLETKVPPGRARAIPTWAETALAKRLQEPQGFESYGAIQEWLKTNLGIIAPYKTVYKLVHYRLASSPKVPRPISVEQSQEQLSAFKKT